MPVIHRWQPTASLAPVLRGLRNGECVVLPTESTYEIVGSALQPSGLAQLQTLATEDLQPAVVVFDDPDWRDWMPWLRGAGARLFRKLGPGPLVLRADGGYGYGLWPRLPEKSRRLLSDDRLLTLRWPAHPVWADLREIAEPLISVPLPAATAEEAAQIVNNQAAWIVDAGPTEFGRLPGTVRVAGRHVDVQREGVMSAEQIRELALCRILFVCTGNTCRSPMAQALCSKRLADRLGCSIAELKQNGFYVHSAGLAAMMGSEASPDAVTVLAQEGIDLSSHRSRSATMEMLTWADHIFTMTASHQDALTNLPVTGIPQPRMLSPSGEDVVDPIGGELADYQVCANQILTCLHQRLPELLES